MKIYNHIYNQMIFSFINVISWKSVKFFSKKEVVFLDLALSLEKSFV